MSYSQLPSIPGSEPSFRDTLEDLGDGLHDLHRQIDHAVGGYLRDIFGDDGLFGIGGKK